MALGSVLVTCVPSPDFVSSAVELESEDLPGATLAVLRSVVAAALLAVDRASTCRKFGVPPGAGVAPPEPGLAFDPAVVPGPPDRPVPLDMPPAPLPALLDFPEELAPPAALEPLVPLDSPPVLSPPASLERPVPWVPPELPEPPAPLAPPLLDLPDAAEALDLAAAPLDPEAVPAPEAAPEPAPALGAPPRRAAALLLEAREEEPVEVGREGEIDLGPTPMHSVRCRAL